MRLYIDIDTGELRRTLAGPVIAGLVLYLRDVLALEIVYVQAGVEVTSTVLAGSAVQRVGLRAKPSDTTLLAQADSYTLSGQIASASLSLNTTELLDWFSTNLGYDSGSADMSMEIEVEAADESFRRTYWQSRVVVRRDVNQPADVRPVAALDGAFIVRRDVTSYALARALVTVGRTLPTLYLFYIGGAWESWTLRTKAGFGENDDDSSYLEPADYDATDNNVVLAKTAII